MKLSALSFGRYLKNSRLQISLIASIVAVAVSLGISFLLTPYIIETLGKEAYSFYPLANNFVNYMTIVTLALNSMASRFITIELVQGNVDSAQKYYSSVFYSNIALSIVLLLPMTLLIILANEILHIPDDIIGDVRILFSCVFLSMIINLITSVFSVSTFATEHMHWRSTWEIVSNLLRAVLLFALYKVFPPSIVFLGIVAIVVASVNGVMQYSFSRKLLPEFRLSLHFFELSYVVKLISSGMWNSINNLGSILTMNIALVVANLLIGVSAQGDLSLVQTLPNFATSVISAVYGVLLARLARVYAEGDLEATVAYVKDSQKILGAISTIPIVLIMTLGKQFFSLWVPSQNAAYLQALSLITMLPVLLHSSMWTVFGLNVTNNRLKMPALILICVGMISIVMTSILVKFTTLGIYAIPISSSVCNTAFYFFFIPAYAASGMGIAKDTFYPHILKTLLFAGCVIAGGAFFRTFLDEVCRSWMPFFIICIILGIVLLILYVMLVCGKDDVRRLMKYYKGRMEHVHE